MKIAFFFAGQGSQRVGMGKDLYEKYPLFRQVYDSLLAGSELKDLSFEGPEERLSQTRYTQPCLVAFAAGVNALLRQAGVRPSLAAGLSLGEYSALMAAGALTPAQAVELAAFRGQAMEEAAAGAESAMIAILGLERDKLEDACRQAMAESAGDAPPEPGEKPEEIPEISRRAFAGIVNYNCPGQLVISGHRQAAERAAELALAGGAKRAVPLKVSGPFHTPLMEPAAEALAGRFAKTQFRPLALPVIFNATARPLGPGETIPGLLVRQVRSPVYLEDSIRYMAASGMEAAVEIGPGKAIAGFIRKTVKEIPVYSVEDAASLEAALSRLKGERHES